MILDLMLCVNDHRNGLHTGVVERIDVMDSDGFLIQLEGPPLLCNSDGRELVLDGMEFKLKGYGTWVGNWCWDCAKLESIHVARIVNHLRESGWDLLEAEQGLWDKFKAGKRITVADLETMPVLIR